MESKEMGSKVPLIQVDGFGFMPGDYRQIVRRYTITNKNNAVVKLISLGAGIQSITVPNKNHDLGDVVLGFDDVRGYMRNRHIGRIINRASDFSRKSLNYQNKAIDIDVVNWDSYVLDNSMVVMTNISQDDSLLTQVIYYWTDENQLRIQIRASSTKPEPVDITSCCFFNLAGHGTGPKELKKHVVTINANKWAELDVARQVVTGVIKDVYRTPYDLRSPTRLNSKKLFQVPGGGYNHQLCINSSEDNAWLYRFHARMLHPTSGRTLEVYSNHPTLHLYTGNGLPDSENYSSEVDDKMYKNEILISRGRLIGKDGMLYKRHGCFALIPRGFPKIADDDYFPSNVLYPGKVYNHDITYDFGMVT